MRSLAVGRPVVREPVLVVIDDLLGESDQVNRETTYKFK